MQNEWKNIETLNKTYFYFVADMGLLSNPKTREKIVNGLKNHGNKMCILCYIAGLIWFLALAYKPLNAGTYFSENALLPGAICITYLL